MDAVTALFVALAAVGAAAAGLHLVGWVPPRYRRMLAAVQKDTATAISDALGAHVEAIMESLNPEEAVQVLRNIESVLTKSTEALNNNPLFKLKGSLGGQATSDARLVAEAKAAIGTDIVGPYMPILQQFAPTVADFLTENPGMAEEILSWPFVQRLIQKGAQMLGQVKGGGGGGEWSGTKNPFIP